MIRRCENPDCPNGPDSHTSADIGHLKSTAKFCGSTCRAEACRVRHPDKYPSGPAQALTGVQGLRPRQALVLATLREASEGGVTTSDFLRAGCGSRFGGRIHELRELGFEIKSERERQGSHRYTLTREPAGLGAGPLSNQAAGAEPNGRATGKGPDLTSQAPPRQAVTNPAAPGDRLFDSPGPQPRGHHEYDDTQEAS